MLFPDNITSIIIILTFLFGSQQLHLIESHVINHKNNNDQSTNIFANKKIDHHQFQNGNTNTDNNNNNYNNNNNNNRQEIKKYLATPTIQTTTQIPIEDLQKFRESLGKKMLSMIDPTADPCEDFYEYACGNWDRLYEEDDTNELNTHFYIGLKEDLLERLEYIITSSELKEKYKINKIYKGLLKAKEYYKTCMKTTDIFKNINKSSEPVQKYLEFIKNNIGFPAIDSKWSINQFNFSKATAYCNFFTSNCLFKIKFADGYPFCPFVIPPDTFGLDGNMKINDFESEYSTNYHMNRELMEYFLKMYGVKDDKKIIKIIDDIMKMGYKLLNASKLGNNSDIEINFLYELEQSKDNYFEWHDYYKTALQNNESNDFFIVLFKNIEFFRNFSSTLFNSNDLEAIANYLSLNVLYQLHVEQKWVGTQKSFCLSKTKIDFSFIIAAIYRDLYENAEENKNLLKIFDSLKNSQIEVILKSDLYSQETKVKSILKIQNLKVSMGYLNDPIIPELIQLIENFQLTDNYYNNSIEGFLLRSKLKFYHSLSRANNTIQPLIVLNPIIINASYNRIKNSIQLNAVGLRPPLYDSKFPQSVIYGATGQMMAHEMSHVFDTDSLKISENIDLNNLNTPWADIDLKIYKNRSDCFIQQYNNKYFPEIDMSVNGNKTLSENIADNGGLLLSYKAYKHIVNQMTYNQLMQEVLPHTDWNHLQTFFIAHAQKYCSTYFRKQYLLESDSIYSFMKLRVNVPLENLPEFGKSFNCPIGSKMNPIEKCSIF